MSCADSFIGAASPTGSHAPVSQTVILLLQAQGGDRRGSLATCLQRLHGFVSLEALSSVYEVTREGQPPTLVLACHASSPYTEQEIRRKVEHLVTRTRSTSHPAASGERIEVLVVPSQTPELAFQRDPAYMLPLAELTPTWQEPLPLQTDPSMLVTRLAEGLQVPFPRDRQNSRPAIPIRLDRVGVRGVTKMLQVGDAAAAHWQEISCDLFADLPAQRSGIHMSRFSDVLVEALDDLDEHAWPHLDSLAETLAQRIRLAQQVEQADVVLSTRFPLKRWTPISGKPTQECYELRAEAVATSRGTKRLLGVQVEGMVACPCAQEMVNAFTQMRLSEDGFDPEITRRMLEITPLATHNQRGVATLLIGTETHLDPAMLVEIAEQAMSSENYGLLKRPDELYIVTKAHRQPRFAEDVVREILLGVIERYPTLPDDAFVWANQRNQETIHKYDVEAQAWGTFGEVRAELVHGTPLTTRTTKDAWFRSKARL